MVIKMLVSLSNIKKIYNGEAIINDATFEINEKDHLGLVGLNGSGKTTLLKIIKGLEFPDAGQVFIKKETKIGYLDQIPVYEGTVYEVLLEAFKDIYSLEKELTKLEKAIKNNPHDAKLLATYGEKQQAFLALDGYSTETQLKMIVKGLKIDEKLLDQKFMVLSGGEKSRVVLAKILLEKPDVLLLDEPSNHLDMDSINFLESFLSTYSGSFLIISHDRYLLDKVCTKIINLENKKTRTYKGNYSQYIEEKKLYIKQQLAEYNAQQKKIKNLEEQITRFKLYAKMGGGEKMDIKAKDRQKKLARLKKVDKPTSKRQVKINLSKTERTSDELIKFIHYSKSFENKTLIKDATFTIYSKDKAFLIGKNGTGKTTLFRSALKEETFTGQIKIAKSAKIGYLRQEIEYADPNRSILHELQYFLDCNEGEARNKLAGFLFFGEDVFKKVSDISGGEKAKLELCKIVNANYNTLFLDEPTNHLDIESKEMLEAALKKYDGTLFIISHDRYFIKKIASYILELNDCKITKYEDDFDYVFNKAEKTKKVVKKVIKKPKTILSNNRINDYKKQLDDIMKQIEKFDNLYKEELKSTNCNYTKIKEYLDEKAKLETKYFNISEIIEEYI